VAVADGLLIEGLLRRQHHGPQHQPHGQQQWGDGPVAARRGPVEGAGWREAARETGTERRGGHGMEKRTVIQMY
jgi:hypothetical protein